MLNICGEAKGFLNTSEEISSVDVHVKAIK